MIAAAPSRPAAATDPLISGAVAKEIVPIDLKTVRVEAVRGVWCLRDNNNILFNFGPNKADAEQAHAVVQRYGFNRIGVVGAPTPVMHYLFATTDAAPPPHAGPLAQAALQAQIDGLSRVGIPVAGVGFVGEMFRFDPRKLEVRKDGGEWQIVSGTELIGRFGPSEFAARDALRAIQDSRFNEFCMVGSAGLTFFLVDGKAPRACPTTCRADASIRTRSRSRSTVRSGRSQRTTTTCSSARARRRARP